tara:strand:- start:105 stop:731 length:627 start_codon:yes stop_codon:yes gene_type:complete
MQSKRVSISRLINPNFEVSCHYLIDRQGNIIKMVDDNKVAWHAGKSKWGNNINLNKMSIGIELVNKGHKFGYEKFTKIQISKLIKLCLFLKKKYKIKNSSILGHSDISPLRKIDPGEKFPWPELNKKGLGVQPKSEKISDFEKFDKSKIKKIFFANLYKIGYRYFEKNKNSQNLLIVKAFKRRFLPKEINGNITQKTLEISYYLAKKS